ncbi:hypothetical protein LEP1GSC061_0395 [Leptospira wolffii serovar Khorat str. Khorat-H2]|nr:hypothetical protein LEP1GSC061_0395 [Leptospira wolffii serovar Khorat str. Khorat-H2]
MGERREGFLGKFFSLPFRVFGFLSSEILLIRKDPIRIQKIVA